MRFIFVFPGMVRNLLRVQCRAFNPRPSAQFFDLCHRSQRRASLSTKALLVDGAVYTFGSWLGDEGAVVRVLDRRRFPPPWTVNNGSALLFEIERVKRSRVFISKMI